MLPNALSSDLFQGAIGLFKNPSSRRRVAFTDATKAAEVVLLADLLLRWLDKSNGRSRPPGTEGSSRRSSEGR